MEPLNFFSFTIEATSSSQFSLAHLTRWGFVQSLSSGGKSASMNKNQGAPEAPLKAVPPLAGTAALPLLEEADAGSMVVRLAE
jgi:hypothetical protein